MVRPQAMRRLRPNQTPGIPAQAAPTTSSSGPLSRHSYQFDGSMKGWCGSLPSTAAPDRARPRPTAQLLLPVAPASVPAGRRPAPGGWTGARPAGG